MRVFISWSGDVSRALAVAIQQWLPMAVHHVDAWISSRDIEPGERWALVLGQALEESDFAVICLTPDNRLSPWILFEAGAVARSREASVVPLLFGIKPSDLDGPLAQFQSVQADRAGIQKLVARLFDASKSGLDSSQREQVFAGMWPLLEPLLGELAEQVRSATVVESPADLLADLAMSAQQGAHAATPSMDKLERLDGERRRLRGQLEYLEAEEARLTQQEAPISLLERAIEPTEQRLAAVETTVGEVLDRVSSKLTSSQIAILRNLITPQGVRLLLRSPSDVPARRADIETLAGLGLVRVGKDGTEIVHDLVASYVMKRFGAA